MAADRTPPSRDELERLLRADPLPEAEPGFRARLQERFLAGLEAGEASSAESSSRPMPGSRTRSKMRDRIEQTIAQTPLAEPARPAFREELARRFVAAEAEPTTLPRFGHPGRVSGSRRRPVGLRERLRQATVVVLAAAAAVAVLFLPDEHAWRVVSLEGDGELALESVPVRGGQRLALGSTLGHGATLTSGDDTLDLELPGWLHLRMLPNTELDLAPLPEDASEPLWMYLTRGEVFLETVEGHPANPIHVATAESRSVVTGTTLGVLRIEDLGTCTCVAEGVVQVEDRVREGEPPAAVRTDEKHFVFSTKEEPVLHVTFPEPGVNAHTDALRDYYAR